MTEKHWYDYLLPIYAVIMTIGLIICVFKWQQTQQALNHQKVQVRVVKEVKQTTKTHHDLSKKMLAFANLIVNYHDDKAKEHSEIERFATTDVANKIIPPGSIGTAGIGPDVSYKVKYTKQEVTFQHPGQPDGQATIHVAYQISTDPTKQVIDLIFKVNLANEKITDFSTYRLIRSQATGD